MSGDDWYTKERLHFAAADGDLAQVQQLVVAGYDVNLCDDLARTPLHYAAENDHFEIVEYLLSVGADVNAHCEQHIGETPLTMTVKHGTPRMVERLLKAGADPQIPGWVGLTAAERAARRNDSVGDEMVALIARRSP